MLTLLSTITAGAVWLASHAWALLLLAAPAVLNFLQPFITAIGQGASGFFGTVWNGAQTNKFANWMLALVIAVVAGAVGYHYGWQACIDWVHAHYRLSTKVFPKSTWWPF